MRLTIPKVVDYITNLEHFCNMDRCEITKVEFQFRAGCITIRFRIVALMSRVKPGGAGWSRNGELDPLPTVTYAA